MKRFGLVICILLVTDCYKNPYNKFFIPNPETQGIQVQPLKEGQPIIVRHVDDVEQADAEMLAKGYVQIGHAFPGYGSGYEAESQAYWTGAAAVIIHRGTAGALFYSRRVTLPRIGIFFRDLNNQDKKVVQTNSGAVVRAIVEDTPPFMANILPGEVFIEIAEQWVRNSDSAYALLEKFNTSKGAQLTVKLIRNKIEKTVTIDF